MEPQTPECTKLATYLHEGHLVQIPFMFNYCNHITVCTSHNAFIYVKLHLQPVRQKLAHWEQVGLQLQHMKHIRDVNSTPYASCFNSNDNESIPMALARLSSPKCMLREDIITKVSNIVLCKIMYFVASKSMIHLQTLLEWSPFCITNANLSSSFCIFGILPLFVLWFVSNSCNVTWFATIQTHFTSCHEMPCKYTSLHITHRAKNITKKTYNKTTTCVLLTHSQWMNNKSKII